jgi:hypothetical protein
MERYTERDHGYGDSPTVEGVPEVVKKVEEECPNCGCREMYLIQVELEEGAGNVRLSLLAGEGKPTGVYLGCPACPFASAMMTSRR